MRITVALNDESHTFLMAAQVGTISGDLQSMIDTYLFSLLSILVAATI
jgi:hypothetical protein